MRGAAGKVLIGFEWFQNAILAYRMVSFWSNGNKTSRYDDNSILLKLRHFDTDM